LSLHSSVIGTSRALPEGPAALERRATKPDPTHNSQFAACDYGLGVVVLVVPWAGTPGDTGVAVGAAVVPELGLLAGTVPIVLAAPLVPPVDLEVTPELVLSTGVVRVPVGEVTVPGGEVTVPVGGVTLVPGVVVLGVTTVPLVPVGAVAPVIPPVVGPTVPGIVPPVPPERPGLVLTLPLRPPPKPLDVSGVLVPIPGTVVVGVAPEMPGTVVAGTAVVVPTPLTPVDPVPAVVPPVPAVPAPTCAMAQHAATRTLPTMARTLRMYTSALLGYLLVAMRPWSAEMFEELRGKN
jgi:hypothetical protein